jgi:prepilin-type N-terminal cleavage/methylation domain-containing protein/prepilin-type processing-associated H-X9-DG protein
MRSRAFTLIELLVVIAIIAILMAILMPSLSLARDHAKRIHCVANTKTLALGWYMYKDDFDGKLVPSNTMNNPPQWVGQEPASGTWQQKQDSIRTGLLFPYVGKSVDIFHCPADTRRPNSSALAAFRTFSIVGGANGEAWGDYTGAVIYSEIKQPAMKYVLVEEADTRGFNEGSWQIYPNTRDRHWCDPVAMWHNKKTTLGFADGHAEMHTWVNQSTIDWAQKAMYRDPSFAFGMTPPGDEQEDITYMAEGFACKAWK